jgi:hypothetical protein
MGSKEGHLDSVTHGICPECSTRVLEDWEARRVAAGSTMTAEEVGQSN